MEQGDESLTGLDCFDGTRAQCSEPGALSGGDKDYDDILELNQFDGLPYSSRFYKLLRERKELPVWKAKCDFMDTLAKEQFVNISGCAKTGRSSQVRKVPLLMAISLMPQEADLHIFPTDSPVVC